MRKLTATIFATLLAVVSVGNANAEIASKGYVDEKTGELETTLDTKADKTAIADMETKTNAAATYATKTAIADMETKTNAAATYATKTEVTSGLAGKQDKALVTSTGYSAAITDDTKYPSVKAVAEAIADATSDIASSDTVSALDTRVTTAEGEINTLKSGKADKATTLAGYGITDAYTKTESDGKYATAAQGALANTALQKSGTLTQGNLLTTDASGKIIDAGKKGALAAKDTVAADDIAANAVTTAKILDGNVTKAKLASEVQASLGKADTALQADAIADMLTKTEAGTTYATKTAIADMETKTNAAATYATKTELTSGLAEKADTTALTAKEDVANKVNAANYETNKTNDTKYPTVKAVADAITKATSNIATSDQLTTLQGRVTTAEGEIDTLQEDVATNTTSIGTVGSLTTDVKTNLVGAINEVDKNANTAQTAADAAQDAADAAQSAAEAAQSTADTAKATADAAIPAPTPACTNLGAKCVLVVGNGGYAWEVVERGTSESVQ